MQRREWKEKRRSDITRVIWVLVGFAVIIGFLTFAISHINGGNADKDGNLKMIRNDAVTIDGKEINAYSVNNNGPYIVIEDLQKFGLYTEVSDSGYITIGVADEQNTDEQDAGDIDLNNKTVEVYYNGKISINDNKIMSGNSTIYYIKDTGEKLILINDLQEGNVLYTDPISGTVNISEEFKTNQYPNADVPNDGTTIDLSETEIVKPTSEPTEEIAQETGYTIFLDAGHGKSSGSMTDSQKRESGWVQNSSGSWGEWRHWANGVFGSDCLGESCNQPNDCWYPIGNGDRDTEPEINLRNCQAAKTYLEEMGYNVVMSRESNNENPSITRRIENANAAGADIYLCVHSNAGGGTGTSYIELDESGSYYGMQRGASYGQQGNILGKMINDKIVSGTSLSSYSGGCISGEPYLIVFQKAPMQCAYLEIGFFDNANDLSILNSEYDSIGKAIAEGIDEYCRTYLN